MEALTATGTPDPVEFRVALTGVYAAVLRFSLAKETSYTTKKGETVARPDADPKAAIMAAERIGALWGVGAKDFDPREWLRHRAGESSVEFIRFVSRSITTNPKDAEGVVAAFSSLPEPVLRPIVERLQAALRGGNGVIGELPAGEEENL